jgi:hypothetical protein
MLKFCLPKLLRSETELAWVEEIMPNLVVEDSWPLLGYWYDVSQEVKDLDPNGKARRWAQFITDLAMHNKNQDVFWLSEIARNARPATLPKGEPELVGLLKKGVSHLSKFREAAARIAKEKTAQPAMLDMFSNGAGKSGPIKSLTALHLIAERGLEPYSSTRLNVDTKLKEYPHIRNAPALTSIPWQAWGPGTEVYSKAVQMMVKHYPKTHPGFPDSVMPLMKLLDYLEFRRVRWMLEVSAKTLYDGGSAPRHYHTVWRKPALARILPTFKMDPQIVFKLWKAEWYKVIVLGFEWAVKRVIGG